MFVVFGEARFSDLSKATLGEPRGERGWVEILLRNSGRIVDKFNECRGKGGLRAFTTGNSSRGSGSYYSNFVQKGNRVLGYNRGLQSQRCELGSSQCDKVASPFLLRSFFFSASKGLSRKGARKPEFTPSRWPAYVRGWRSYYEDRQGVRHFKKRGPTSWAEKLSSQKSMVWIGGSVFVGSVIYVNNLETVPYTHRKHFVLISPPLEKSIGERGFKMILNEYKNRVLPPGHPLTVRVHRIASQITEALMLGTSASNWGEVESVGDVFSAFGSSWDTVNKKSDAPLLGPTNGDQAHSSDEAVDEIWVDRSRQEGLRKGEEGFKKHLEGMQWQVIVVDDDIVNAFCLPGGKIVVFTGFLKKFSSDAEIACVLGHEIGHAVARHSAESLTHNLFLMTAQMAVLSVLYVPSLVNSVSEFLLRLPHSRKMEMEADHIGLILMAAAGYDPRLAPAFYEKMARIEKAPEFAQYLSTHPSGKRRGSRSSSEEMEGYYRVWWIARAENVQHFLGDVNPQDVSECNHIPLLGGMRLKSSAILSCEALRPLPCSHSSREEGTGRRYTLLLPLVDN
ncbi:hypothetical protein R1flu_007354 [Riccia fluitans]|uniref:Peptidase M48 domain-containing protein n=1 Tax=Riccia fluitans TaxID=41844 RepID=A0ABD1YZG1_9MARC